MTNIVRRMVLAGAFATASTFAGAMSVDSLQRKAGHWEITTVAAGTGMTTVQACIGTDDNVALPENSGDCSKPKVTPAGSEIIVDVVCKKEFGKQTMSTAFGGDFNSHYHAIMKMSFDPPDGLKNMGVTIDAKYIGPECAPNAPQSAPSKPN